MTAIEARILTKNYDGSIEHEIPMYYKREYENLQKLIYGYVRQGKFEFYYLTMKLSDSIINLLKKDGYKVEKSLFMGVDAFKISWNE